jgi:hypothetical protein
MIFIANNFYFFSNRINFNYGEIISTYNNLVLVSANLKNDFFFNRKQYRSFFFKYGVLNSFLPFFFRGLDYYWTNRFGYFYPFKALRLLALKNSQAYLIEQIQQKFQLKKSVFFLLSIFRRFYSYSPNINFLSKSKTLFFLRSTNVNVSFVKFIARLIYKPLLVRSKFIRQRDDFEFVLYKDQYLTYKRYYRRFFRVKFRKLRSVFFSSRKNVLTKSLFRRRVLIRRILSRV